MNKRKWGLMATLVSYLAITQGGLAADTATDTAAHGPLPIAKFIQQPNFSNVTISPDGRYFAAIMPSPDDPYTNKIVTIDSSTGKIVHLWNSGSGQLYADYFWAGNDQIVDWMAKRQNGLDRPELTGQLFEITADHNEQMNLFGRNAHNGTLGSEMSNAYATVVSRYPIGEDKILVDANFFTSSRKGSNTMAALIDLGNGHLDNQGISPVPNATFVADHTGLARIAYGLTPSADHVVWLRASPSAQWTLLNEPSKSGFDFVPIGFNRDNSKLYVRKTHGDGPDAIELLDLASHTFRTVYQGQFADPGELLPTADGLDYYAVITRDGEWKLFYIDENSQEAQLSKALAANFPGQLAYFSSFTRDGKRAIVKVISDRNPGDYYLFDLDTRNARFAFSAMPWIDPQQMRPKQPISLTARDGLLLHGFLTLPSGNKPFPLIVLPHGGPYGIADEWTFDPDAQLFASRGYAVLQINYRGSSGYGINFIKRGYMQWGMSMQDDLTDATEWAVHQGYADSQHICIYGASYGGYAALEGAVREPDLYKCAVGYAGVYDLRVEQTKSDMERSDYGDAYMKLAMGNNDADLLRRSPLGGVNRIKADILLIHGKEDERAPYKNFKELTGALDQNGKHYETLVEPDEGHGFFLPAHREEAYEKTLEFLDRNIGPTSVAANNSVKASP
jgi:dipeptidyl aminopeptidase/acylaminoacyl peptidase